MAFAGKHTRLDAGLALLDPIVGKPTHRVDACKPNRWLVVAQLSCSVLIPLDSTSASARRPADWAVALHSGKRSLLPPVPIAVTMPH